MRIELGIPDLGSGAPLPRRLAWLTGIRLIVLCAALALVTLFYLRGRFSTSSYTVRVAFFTLGASFALAAVYAALLRFGRRLNWVAYAQMFLDQVMWTVVVYLSGGASSGAVSFYGLSCVAGAILAGPKGAAASGTAAGVSYLGLVAALRYGWLSPPPDQPISAYITGDTELAFLVTVNLLAVVVVALLAGYLAERLRLTGGELQEAHERVEQAERMAALGRLAAGLAHEIRNPLSSISGSIQLIRQASGLGAEDRQLCEIVLREASRLNDLVTDMMDLARPRVAGVERVDVAMTAREVVELMSTSGRAASDVSVAYRGVESAVVRADPAQLRQVIWNLARNAVQASSAGDQVVVQVERTNGQVELRVVDRGIGIEHAARDKIFDAFFTTRSKGTGVGLAVVKRIVDEHGFEIFVEAEKDRGATFRVLMPETTGAPAESE